LLKFFRAKG